MGRREASDSGSQDDGWQGQDRELISSRRVNTSTPVAPAAKSSIGHMRPRLLLGAQSERSMGVRCREAKQSACNARPSRLPSALIAISASSSSSGLDHTARLENHVALTLGSTAAWVGIASSSSSSSTSISRHCSGLAEWRRRHQLFFRRQSRDKSGHNYRRGMPTHRDRVLSSYSTAECNHDGLDACPGFRTTRCSLSWSIG